MADWCELPENIRSKILPVTESGCWLWVGCCHPSGYGKAWVNRKLVYAHRATYSLLVGNIPDNFTLDHLCRVRCCVNPYHLEAVTIGVNIARGKATITLCPKGHELSGQNLRKTSRGHRECLRCHNDRTRAFHLKNPRGYDKKYYHANKEKIQAWRKEWSKNRRRLLSHE